MTICTCCHFYDRLFGHSGVKVMIATRMMINLNFVPCLPVVALTFRLRTMFDTWI